MILLSGPWPPQEGQVFVGVCMWGQRDGVVFTIGHSWHQLSSAQADESLSETVPGEEGGALEKSGLGKPTHHRRS